jgi:hypothetical protein
MYLICSLALKNGSICSILRCRVSFMLITILAMINLIFNSTKIYRLRLIPGLKYNPSSGSYLFRQGFAVKAVIPQ